MKSLVYLIVGCWVAVRRHLPDIIEESFAPLWRTAQSLGRDYMDDRWGNPDEVWRRKARLEWLARNYKQEDFDPLADLALRQTRSPGLTLAGWWYIIKREYNLGQSRQDIEKEIERIANGELG